MGDFRELGINIAASVVFFVIGVALRSLVLYLRARPARTFWGPNVRRAPTTLLLSSFPQFRGFEPSGLVGLGDTRAAFELTRHLLRLRVRHDIGYSSGLTDGQMKNNLVLLGGGDVSALVKLVISRSNLKYRIAPGPPLAVIDSQTGNEYRAHLEEASREAVGTGSEEALIEVNRNGKAILGRVRSDYGILVRTRSPYSLDRTVVMITGLYGFGTWAGGRLLNDPSFLAQCRQFNGDPFECFFRVDLLQGLPINTEVLELRRL